MFLTGTYLPSETSWNISAKEKGSLSPHSYFTLQSSEDESLEYGKYSVEKKNTFFNVKILLTKDTKALNRKAKFYASKHLTVNFSP